ncbi:MAG: queuosine precursor transporter [Xanthomonadaceae bacterium]|jgi:hypothetical protein|nr:queuosine precursor transporter [Xanthomonadaceae bacterium]
MHGADTARTQRLFVVLAGFFICNALMAEFIGVKVFALEPTLGIDEIGWNFYGVSGTLNFTAGVLLWPVVFVMTDVINEFFGRRGVRFISWLAVFLIVYAFLFAWIAIQLAPAAFWVDAGQAQSVADMQVAFAAIFGQGMWTIAGSVVAFAVGQVVDVAIYHRVRRVTGEKMIWLRATGSTLVSQLVDSFIVLYIAFVLGPQQWSTEQWLAVGTVNYLYKALLALLLTPVIYGAHRAIEAWLGRETANALKRRAAAGG